MKKPAITPELIELLQNFVDQQQHTTKKPKRQASKRAPVSLSEEEMLKVLAIARGRRLRDWVLFLVTYRHGLRASEALAIRRQDLEGGRLRKSRGKGSEPVDQPLLGHENPLLNEIDAVSTWLAEMGDHGAKGAAKAGGRRARAKTLQSSQNVKFRACAWCRKGSQADFYQGKGWYHAVGSGNIMCTAKRDAPKAFDDRLFPFTRQRYFQLFRQYAIEAGLPPRKRSPHKLKHSIAKHLLRSNVPVNEVQEWLGWKSLRTADHYTRPDADEVAQSVDRALRSKATFRQLQQAGLFES